MADDPDNIITLPPIYVTDGSLDRELAKFHGLPDGTTFSGTVGTGYIDYWTPDSDFEAPSGQVYDERYYVPPEQRTGDNPIDIADWDPEQKQEALAMREAETAAREKGEDPKTPANAAARVYIAALSPADQKKIAGNKARIADLKATNKKYEDSWNPYNWFRNAMREETINVLKSQNADIAAGRSRSTWNHINDGVVAFSDTIVEGTEGLASGLTQMGEDIARRDWALLTGDQQTARDIEKNTKKA